MLFVGINGSGGRGRVNRLEMEVGPSKRSKKEGKEKGKVGLGTNERLFQAPDVCIFGTLVSDIGSSFRLCIFTLRSGFLLKLACFLFLRLVPFD